MWQSCLPLKDRMFPKFFCFIVNGSVSVWAVTPETEDSKTGQSHTALSSDPATSVQAMCVENAESCYALTRTRLFSKLSDKGVWSLHDFCILFFS